MSIPSRVIVIALVVAGCSGGALVRPDPVSGAAESGPGSSSEKAGAQIELRFDETAEYRDLELRWLDLEDSRCPIGVKCVWAGQIVVTIEAVRGDEGPVELELLHRVGRAPQAARAFAYELVLQGVDPHPKQGVTPERAAYVAVLEITQP